MRRYYETDAEFPDGEKYLYLLLYAPGHTGKINEPIRGNTWLQKIMYTVTQSIPSTDYEFDEYTFGAFSPSLETVQIQNRASGLIDQPLKDGPLQLSPRGRGIAKHMWDEAAEGQKQMISEIKSFLNEMTYWELIAYSYSAHPETASQSDIKPGFRKNRMSAAVNLFKRKKVSLKKAASIAGKSVDEFEQILLEKRVNPYELTEEKYAKSMKLIEGIT